MGKGRKSTFELMAVLEEVDRFLAEHDLAIDTSRGVNFDRCSYNLPRVRLTITQARKEQAFVETLPCGVGETI